MDAKQYLQELAQTVGLDPSITAGVMKALENPKFATELSNGVARQSDYSRAMDDLRTKQAAIDKIAAEQTQWWEKTRPAVEQLQPKLAAYEKRFGPIEGDGNGGDRGAGLSKADIEKMLSEQAEKGMRFTANVSKQLGYVLQDYSLKFPGKLLDLEAVEKRALETNTTIRQAYEDMIKPDLEAKSKADHEAELKKAREEGGREALSKHNIPIDSAPAEQAPFFRTPVEGEKPLNDGERARSFAKQWNESAGQGAAL